MKLNLCLIFYFVFLYFLPITLILLSLYYNLFAASTSFGKPVEIKCQTRFQHLDLSLFNSPSSFISARCSSTSSCYWAKETKYTQNSPNYLSPESHICFNVDQAVKTENLQPGCFNIQRQSNASFPLSYELTSIASSDQHHCTYHNGMISGLMLICILIWLLTMHLCLSFAMIYSHFMIFLYYYIAFSFDDRHSQFEILSLLSERIWILFPIGYFFYNTGLKKSSSCTLLPSSSLFCCHSFFSFVHQTVTYCGRYRTIKRQDSIIELSTLSYHDTLLTKDLQLVSSEEEREEAKTCSTKCRILYNNYYDTCRQKCEMGTGILSWYNLFIFFFLPCYVSSQMNLIVEWFDFDLTLTQGTNFDFNQFSSGIIFGFSILMCIGLTLVVYHLFLIHASAQKWYFGRIYLLITAIMLIIPLTWSNVFTFHFHHFMIPILLFPLTNFQSKISLFAQGILTGIFINGLALWGFAPMFLMLSQIQ